MRYVNVLSCASYLPGEPITNEDLAELIGPLASDLLDDASMDRRHWLIDRWTGEIKETNSEMSAKAARRALEKADLAPEDVDLLVLSTCSPDYLLPASVTLVQELLGLRRAATVQVCSGCAGAIQAMDIANMYLSSGQYKTAVVIGTEVISPVLYNVYRERDKEAIRLRDAFSVYSFGDGSAALVLQADEHPNGAIIGRSSIACVGGDKKVGMHVPLGGTAIPLTHQALDERLFTLKVDFKGSVQHTPYVLKEGLLDTLQAAGVKAKDIDLCIIPEGNAGYLRNDLEKTGCLTEEWLDLEHCVYDNLRYVANTGSPAVFLAFEQAIREGKVKAGDRVMFLAIETSKWLFGGLVFEWHGN
ncbi:3-oxoacyl-ACP synthase III family protein [Brevibacillus fulvus]|uniref:3-oxoacyl-[acyl-carrier-protein] synthase-3 n=1 Tax=Brevibacillus fulvus TaxID=1125967 RepID=A0A939BNS3_9BACL|nr:3-oxoacyl-ACP synthase III family protein [Brevibacillus fulvus]MBM7589560.1 3-oxoacyl-[acyl-carrier-protein] synthase-3 [Brevibacillus fulvus]